jgi:hypothetical protein
VARDWQEVVKTEKIGYSQPSFSYEVYSVVYLRNNGGTDMSAHDSEHAHHEPEDESLGVKIGIFFICVLVTLFLIALL